MFTLSLHIYLSVCFSSADDTPTGHLFSVFPCYIGTEHKGGFGSEVCTTSHDDDEGQGRKSWCKLSAEHQSGKGKMVIL